MASRLQIYDYDCDLRLLYVSGCYRSATSRCAGHGIAGCAWEIHYTVIHEIDCNVVEEINCTVVQEHVLTPSAGRQKAGRKEEGMHVTSQDLECGYAYAYAWAWFMGAIYIINGMAGTAGIGAREDTCATPYTPRNRNQWPGAYSRCLSISDGAFQLKGMQHVNMHFCVCLSVSPLQPATPGSPVHRPAAVAINVAAQW
ncbi:hypothetical protein EDC01DRAFT_242253 [Geopyxis carbonaria]|nr:hypothetical protein EDC01DRAFT_242253 [Geopyxis carbonaria]